MSVVLPKNKVYFNIMKLLYYLIVFLGVLLNLHVNASPSPLLSKLFGGFSSGGYGGGYYPRPSSGGYGGRYYSRPRSYGRSYDYGEGGGERYKSICRVHAVDSLAFPGRIGRPVCP